MLWDLIQQSRIERAERSASNAGQKAELQAIEQRDLTRQVEHLTLACQAMWELLRDHSGLTEGQLERKMKEIDERDGRRDGRISRRLRDCPACGRPVPSHLARCVSCSARMPKEHAFES